jgi:16S rRNA U516 pseudouridylate synthase RsuA-like enzyme
MTLRWSKVSSSYIESPQNVEDFLAAVEELCRKHRLSITHEDGHGAFIITDLNKNNIKNFNGAHISIRNQDNVTELHKPSGETSRRDTDEGNR